MLALANGRSPRPSSNVSKPVLDLILFNIQLGRSLGGKGSLGLFASYFATAWILRKVTPAFGKLAAVEAKLEGDFRAAHSRLIINSEEVAYVVPGDEPRQARCSVLRLRVMQVLRRRSHRKRHPHAGLLAPDQACQLDLQGALGQSRKNCLEQKTDQNEAADSDCVRNGEFAFDV